MAPYRTTDYGRWTYEGKSYPSEIRRAPHSNGMSLYFGGLIRGDKDCPWDKSLIGWFFAVEHENEYVAERTTRYYKTKDRLRRWYEIADVIVNEDGTKDLKIMRYWWGARPAGSPT